jgi:hypothetical protein
MKTAAPFGGSASARSWVRAIATWLALALGSCTGPGLEPPGEDNSLGSPTPAHGSGADGGALPPDRSQAETPPGAVQPGNATPGDAGVGSGRDPSQTPPEPSIDEDAGS